MTMSLGITVLDEATARVITGPWSRSGPEKSKKDSSNESLTPDQHDAKPCRRNERLRPSPRLDTPSDAGQERLPARRW